MSILLSLVFGWLGLMPVGQEAPTPTPPPPPQAWVSPTPDAEGVISVIVQPQESLWAIAARAGLTLPELLALNNLTESDVIRPGDVIIIGRVEAPPTPVSPEEVEPTPTRPPPTPRPTRRPPQATICLSAFADLDRDGVHDPGEPLRAAVAFTVYNSEAVVGNYITDGQNEPHCFPPLPPGNYRVTRSVLPDEVLTTAGDWALQLGDENTLMQAFGSYTAAELSPGDPAPEEATPTPSALSAAPEDGQPVTEENVAMPSPDVAETFNSTRTWQLAGIITLFGGGLLLLMAVLLLLRRQSRSAREDAPPD